MRRYTELGTNGRLVFADDQEFEPATDPSALSDLISIERRPIGDAVIIDPEPFAYKHGSLLMPPAIELPAGAEPLYSLDVPEPHRYGHVENLADWLVHARSLSDIMRLYTLACSSDPFSQIALVSMALDQVITFKADGKMRAALMVRGSWDGAAVIRSKGLAKVPTSVYAYAQSMGCAIAEVAPIDGDGVEQKVDWLCAHAAAAAQATLVRYMELHSAPVGTLLGYIQDHARSILRDEAPALNFCRICGCAVSPLEGRQTFESGYCKFKLYQDRERTISQLEGLGLDKELATRLVSRTKGTGDKQ